MCGEFNHTHSYLLTLNLVLCHCSIPVWLCSLLCQDVFGSDAPGGQRRKVHVPLHRPLHVGGCRAEEQNHGGKCILCVCGCVSAMNTCCMCSTSHNTACRWSHTGSVFLKYSSVSLIMESERSPQIELTVPEGEFSHHSGSTERDVTQYKEKSISF